MNAQHTPTPWTTTKGRRLHYIHARGAGQVVAQVNAPEPTATDDAAFIVRACNSHDALVAALKMARTVLEGAIHPSCRKSGDTIGKINAALAAAGEGA